LRKLFQSINRPMVFLYVLPVFPMVVVDLNKSMLFSTMKRIKVTTFLST